MAPLRPVCVRAVLNHPEIVRAGDTRDFIHVRKPHRQVHWKDGPGLRCYGLLNELGVKAISVRIDVHENRNGVQQHDGTDAAFPRVSRDDHFITRPDSRGLERNLNRYRPVGDGQAILGAVKRRKFLSEGTRALVRKRIAAPIATGEDFLNRAALFPRVDWPARERFAPNGLASGDRQFSHPVFSLEILICDLRINSFALVVDS